MPAAPDAASPAPDAGVPAPDAGAAAAPEPIAHRPPRLRDIRGYARIWTASTVSDFGTYVTGLALQVVVVVTLHASATEVGVLGAARWVPYLGFGLVAGVLVDRYRRRPVLVGTDLVRGLALLLIPALAALHALSVPFLIGFTVVFGALSLFNEAASQSFLPRVVTDPAALTAAYARIETSGNVAATTGPMVASGLIALIGAPLAIAVDAVSYLVSGAILRTVPVAERPSTSHRRNLRRELREGLAWVYRHRMLAPMALTTHLWFVATSMLGTVFVLYALRGLSIGVVGLGVAGACAGAGGVLGSLTSTRFGARFGLGPVAIAARWLSPLSLVPLLLASGGWSAWLLVAVGQFVFGLSLSLDSPIDLAYRQTVTPDRLQGRMNATIRSTNWGVRALGAPLGGVLADALGYRPTLWVTVVLYGTAAVALWLSPYRHARLTDRPPTPPA